MEQDSHKKLFCGLVLRTCSRSCPHSLPAVDRYVLQLLSTQPALDLLHHVRDLIAVLLREERAIVAEALAPYLYAGYLRPTHRALLVALEPGVSLLRIHRLPAEIIRSPDGTRFRFRVVDLPES